MINPIEVKGTFNVKADISLLSISDEKVKASVIYRAFGFAIMHEEFDIMDNNLAKLARNLLDIVMWMSINPDMSFEALISATINSQRIALITGTVDDDKKLSIKNTKMGHVGLGYRWLDQTTQSVFNTVQRILRMPSVEKHMLNLLRSSGVRLRADKIQRRSDLTFEEFAQIASDFELYDDEKQATRSTPNYDVVVNFDVLATNPDIESKSDVEVREWHNYSLALTRDQLEDFDRRLTEINAKNQARKLSKAAERLT